MATRLGLLTLLVIILGAVGSCRKDKPPQLFTPPIAPNLLTATAWSDSTIKLTWNDRSFDEYGFLLRIHRDTIFVRTDTLPANSIQKIVPHLISGTTYRFSLTSYNEAGESDSAAELTSQTTGTPPPEPPINVHAQVLAPTVIRVMWTRVGTLQTFLVSRRTLNDAWITVGSRPATDSSYTDSTLQPVSTYYYRIGAQTGSSVAWSVDSAMATTPDGPPLAPDSLRSSVLIGYGVTLTWHDRSMNETGFHISRSWPGHGFTTIDSVGANITTYTDLLGNQTGDYVYRVRAYNAIGVSAWTPVDSTHYDYCSSGVLPLCVGNFWDYVVTDTVGGDYHLRREIVQLDYPTGLDYYLLAQWVIQPTPIPDTLYYLRNFSPEPNSGCWKLNHPAGLNPVPQMLYKYPAMLSDYYYVDGDCVLVAGIGVSISVNGVPYTSCNVYQRFFDVSHSIQVYVKPGTVGIVREQEFVGDVPVVRRDIIGYHVQNQ
jgi:hypothetical protein